MRIEKLMTHDVVTVAEDATLADAARRMWEADCGFVPVVDRNDRLCGVITDRDICMGALTTGQPLHAIPVTSSMTTQVHACRARQDVKAAYETMRLHKVRRLPVVDQGRRVQGVVSLNDLATHCGLTKGTPRDVSPSEVAQTLAAICEHGAAGAGASAAVASS